MIVRLTKQQLTLLGLGSIVLLFSGCTEPLVEADVIRPVKTLVLESTGSQGSRAFPGTVQASRRADLSFRVSGPLASLPVKEGQEIRQGAILARIDPRDFETNVSNLEARLADLQSQYAAMKQARPEDIRSLEAALSAAQSRLIETTATFRRYQELYANNNVSKAEYDQRRAARDVAQAEVRRAQESLNVAEAGARPEDLQAMEARIRSMQAQLQQGQDQLSDTSLRAPYTGQVAELYVDNFEFVQARQSILSLQDVSIVEVVAQIPEGIIAQGDRNAIRGLPGEELPDFVISFESLTGQSFPAEISEVSTQADPLTHTYSVTFRTPQPAGGIILAGMTAEVRAARTAQSETTFNIPVGALIADEQGRQFVWVLDESPGVPRKVAVETGEMVGDSVIVQSGLSAGDQIVIAGAAYLAEGQEVRLITDELRDRR